MVRLRYEICDVFTDRALTGNALAVFTDANEIDGDTMQALARHGRIRFGEEIVIEQGTEIRRPSKLHARVTGSHDRVEAVEVGGGAVVIGAGEIRL